MLSQTEAEVRQKHKSVYQKDRRHELHWIKKIYIFKKKVYPC